MDPDGAGLSAGNGGKARTDRALGLVARLVVLLAVGGGFVWLSIRSVSLGEVWSALLQARVGWLIAAGLSVITVTAAKAGRWWFLYPSHQRPDSMPGVFGILTTSQMLNLLIPVRLGELARMGLMLQEGVPIPTTVSTLIVEKSVELLAAGVLLALAAPAAILPRWLPSSVGVMSAVGGAAVLICLYSVWRFRRRISALVGSAVSFRGWLSGRWQERITSGFESMIDGLVILTDLESAVPVVALTALGWAASVFTIGAALAAYGFSVRWHVAFVLSLALYLSNIVPTPPALVGVVSAVTIVTLDWFGFSGDRVAVAGLALNAVLVAPIALVGGWSTLYRFAHLTRLTLADRWRDSLGLRRGDRPTG